MNETHERKTAFPLCWPEGWPKTEITRKESAKFKQTLAGALSNLKIECARLGGKNLILSSNYTLGNERPMESGVVAYFLLDTSNIAIPCDRWKLVEHNVQAIALTIEAMRGMERWGAKHMIKAMFTGFKQLPAPGINWYQVLGVPINASRDQVREAYMLLVKKHHPDRNGDPDLFRRVQEAWEIFEKSQSA